MMERIDVLLVAKGLAKSRTAASVYIKEGRVSVNGKTVSKPSERFDECDIAVEYPENDFVSRGGKKLLGAIEGFDLDVKGKVCLDIGASTGGFTQCLLLHGASEVYAVDSGTDQLDMSLRKDSRVVCRENTNARYLRKTDFEDAIDLVVMDVSFISQTLIYPSVADILEKNGIFVSLVKPQFELTKSRLSKNGIVKDKDGRIYEEIIEKIRRVSSENGLILKNVIKSPITGGDGNTEYLALFVKE